MTRLDQIRRRLEAAQQEVFALCKGKHWRMTVPVQDDDSDRTLMASLGDLRDLLAVCEAAKVFLESCEQDEIGDGTLRGWWSERAYDHLYQLLSRLDAPEVEG